ncbi:MAG TPA: sigma factor [Thermoanaerobaculia bacterium]|nr:sigma factor [Thermoanaerobaculia bacterium]
MDNPTHHRDLLLLRQIASQEQTAFTELFDQRAPAILGVLSRVLDRAQAEEVLLEVFAEVWEKAPRFHPNGTSPFSWMLQLARDRAAERLRAARRVSADRSHSLQTV